MVLCVIVIMDSVSCVSLHQCYLIVQLIITVLRELFTIFKGLGLVAE